jgi:nitroreductase
MTFFPAPMTALNIWMLFRCTVRSGGFIEESPRKEEARMHKPAPSHHPINELIASRWSPRAFAGKDVEPAVLRSLFEAARWAPSCSNEQPWAYLVATKDDKEQFAKMLGILVETNQKWAKYAPMLALAIVELAFAKNGAPNRNAPYDVGAANALLTIEATSRGLAVHQMAGYDNEKARQAFSIPAGWDPIAVLAVGYPGEAESLPQPYQDRERLPRVRKPIAEFVMSGQWGHTAEFLSE